MQSRFSPASLTFASWISSANYGLYLWEHPNLPLPAWTHSGQPAASGGGLGNRSGQTSGSGNASFSKVQ